MTNRYAVISKQKPIGFYIFHTTLDPQSFEYQFLTTLDERGQSIPTMGIKEGGGERTTKVTRIITYLKDDSTVHTT